MAYSCSTRPPGSTTETWFACPTVAAPTPAAPPPAIILSSSTTLVPNRVPVAFSTSSFSAGFTNGTTSAAEANNTSPSSSDDGSVPTLAPNGHHSGVSAGATAGIAIGCAAAGLVIGLLVALLFFRRRKNKDPSEIGQVVSVVESKMPPPNDHDGSGTDILLSQFLLDGAPDQDIVKELQSLGELIRQHVESNYHIQPLDVSVETLSHSLLSLGLGEHGGLGTEAIAALCVDTTTRHLGLRTVISHVLFASIDFHSRSRLSMLPGPVAAFLQSVPAAEHGGSNPFGNALSSIFHMAPPLRFSPPPKAKPANYPANDAMVTPQAQALTNALNTFLHRFIAQEKRSRQANHLQEVIVECAKLGYVLLSHPVDWKFVFEGGSSQAAEARTVVVCPGLEKLSDRDGTPYRPPRRIAAPAEIAL
ncbi:hypothetical protein PT974_01587 [Cladobotryum mycophilum]|uniref:Uncharacterized protein n=1 Tax=Cladobotryum mycophilum TaxID=491253 RepID=A0ABR0T5H4_9HYPO